MMKMQVLFIFISFVTCVRIANANPAIAKSISQRVESSRISQDRLGLVVTDSTGHVLYELNSDKKFTPASLTKIVTAAAILEKLPVGHQFLTQILSAKSGVGGGTISGPIYLRGGGDPGFVSESMWFLVNEFVRTGIREIRGDIVVDDSRFDSVRFDPSRDQSRVDRAYDAPIGAMTFNWSAVNIFVRPGAKVGDPARVFADPETDYIKVKNLAKTSKAGKKTKIEVKNMGIRKVGTSSDGGEEIVVSGEIPLGGAEFVAYKSITKPEIWAGIQLREFLKQRGVKVVGNITAGRAPSSAAVLAEFKGKPVGSLVESMMKFSNNYIAEILTKDLAAEVTGAPGTMEKGVQVLRTFLKEKGIDDVSLVNPSGLSRANQFRPRDLIKILVGVNHNFRIYPEYLSSLPIAGVDGTLKRRLNVEALNGHVRAKTGHLAGVAGLGGFVSAPEGQVYAFVFLYNGRDENEAYKSRDLFDKIIVELLKAPVNEKTAGI